MRHLSTACSILIVAFVIFASCETRTQTLPGSQGQFSTIINGDGTVKPDVTGNFDPSGYHQQIGETEKI